jgi:cytochrome c-type biogenesis protein CcmH
MTEFWMLAGLMLAVALAFLLWPVWHARRESGRWSFTGTAVALLTIPIAVMLYSNISNWEGGTDSEPAGNAQQLAIVEQLAERMQQNPDDVEGWMLLGRSYFTLQQYVPARQAFMQAWQRTAEPGNDLKLWLGMAMIHSERSSLGSDGGQLIEEVLQSEPSNQQALWYGGLVALERGRQDLARRRWSALLATNPPPEVAQVLERQIAMLGETPAGGPFASSGLAPSDSSAPPASGGGPEIHLTVRLGEGVSTAHLGPNAALFIFARAAAGGPPLAVMRQSASAIPGEFTLSDANTMIQGNSLDNFDELTLVARLSASGQPIESSGDLFAEAQYDMDAEDSGPVELVIDQVVP